MDTLTDAQAAQVLKVAVRDYISGCAKLGKATNGAARKAAVLGHSSEWLEAVEAALLAVRGSKMEILAITEANPGASVPLFTRKGEPVLNRRGGNSWNGSEIRMKLFHSEITDLATDRTEA
jgi:hypothetical protein